MIKTLVLSVTALFVMSVYAQRMDQDFTPPAIVDHKVPGAKVIYPDKAFTIITEYEDNAVGPKIVDGKTIRHLEYATGGVLYTYTLPGAKFATYGTNTPMSKEKFLSLPEVQGFIQKYSR